MHLKFDGFLAEPSKIFPPPLPPLRQAGDHNGIFLTRCDEAHNAKRREKGKIAATTRASREIRSTRGLNLRAKLSRYFRPSAVFDLSPGFSFLVLLSLVVLSSRMGRAKIPTADSAFVEDRAACYSAYLHFCCGLPNCNYAYT